MFGGIFGSRKIHLSRVDLGACVVRVPVADITGNRPGRTLLVTGGMDGDEYAGIEAAYALIEAYKDGNFAGRLIVIPIVNAPGFWNESSHNPMDDILPKMRFPGRANGMPTERLVHFVAEYAKTADCWYDLHGGAVTEGLNPFLWLYKTGTPAVDALAEAVCRLGVASLTVYEPAHVGSKARQLAKHGCTYITAESGSRAGQLSSDVERHLGWLRSVMQLLGMMPGDVPAQTSTILNRVVYYSAPGNGLWRPAPVERTTVVRGEVLGTYYQLDGTDVRQIRATSDGIRLWWKETLRMKKGDMLHVIGRP